MKRVAKGLLWTFGVLLLLLVAAVLLAPSVAKWGINHYGESLTGRKLQVESVQLNVLTGTVKIKDFTMYEANPDSGRFIHLTRLYTDVRMTALPGGRLELDSVYFGQLSVHIDQNQDFFNFTDLIERFASSDTLAADSTSAGSKPLPIVLRNIKFAGSSVRYRDIPLGATFDLRDISLYIPVIDLTDLRAMLGLHFEFERGGVFSTELLYDDRTHNYDLQLKLADLPLSYGLPYMRQYLYADSVRGRMSTELRIQGNTDHLIQLDLSGKVHCRDLEFYALSEAPVFAFDSLEVALRGIDLAGKKLMVSNLALADLHTSYMVYPDSTTNWSRIVRPSDEELLVADSSEVAEYPDEELMEAALELDSDIQYDEPSDWHLVADRVNLSQIGVVYVDSTLAEPFRYELSGLQLAMRNFDNQQQNTAEMQGVLQQKGTVKLKWRGRVDNMLNQYLSLSVANVALSDFSPYALAYTAHPLIGGNLSFSSENTVTDGMLKGMSRLEVYRPQAGDKDKSVEPEYKVPLKMVLYLLTDAHGYMQMELPVSGAVTDPDFSYKRLLVKTLMNALGRIAASPFNAIAKSVNGKKSSLSDFMETDFTQTQLGTRQYAFLDDLAEFWKEHPQLSVGLSLEADPEALAFDWAKRSLQLAYYRSQHPQLTDEDLHYMDLSVIYAQDINQKPVKRFVEAQAAESGLEKQKNYKATVQQLYGADARSRLQTAMQAQSEQVRTYLVQTRLVPDSLVSVDAHPVAAQGGSTKCGYRLQLSVPGESSDSNE
ncbi:MAG: DUF748 domain-containing protein [Paludibacteraceae bacterium]|nr:DUF748 domain-containing protein [Paludibacteraceae bacterium]